MEKRYIPSNGAGQICCYFWRPEGTPRAVAQLVHGIAEHCGRYDDFASWLTMHGIAVVAEDHMGHGLSAESGSLGAFTGGWMAAVDDTCALLRRTKQALPQVPYFLLGHSMGSFMARTILCRNPELALHGAILSGTGWQPSAALRLGLVLCAREEKRYGPKGHSPLLKKLIFGAYNREFGQTRTENDWICTVSSVVDAYGADPLCGFDPTISLCRDLLEGISYIQKRDNLAKMEKSLPVLFFSGAKDPVGAMGKGVQKTVEAFRRVGMQNVHCTIYPDGRHEMLNECNHMQVYEDVLRWMEEQI